MATSEYPSGGFLLSPPASSTISSTSTIHAALPHPRGTPLRAGGSKESTFIHYVDQRLLHMQRRFAKRTSPSSKYLSDVDRDKADTWDDVKGYPSMKEACKDIEELVGIVWVSGTPSLQVPYLINMAVMVGNYIQGMPPSPRALFRTLDMLDHAFASLLQGRDVESGERLPGFEGGRGVSGTEKVRIRSQVERSRLNVVEAFRKGDFEEESVVELEDDDGDRMDTDGELILENGGDETGEDAEDSWDMQIARVYDRTVVELGDSLVEPDIGILTENRG